MQLDPLTLIVLAAFIYLLLKEGEPYLSGISSSISSAVSGAKKPLAYLLMLLTAAFFLGQLYAVWISGFVLPSTDVFWLPLLLLIVLAFYNYL